MARRIIIDFDLPTERRDRNALIHRIGNFGEELYHACVDDGWASIPLEEIDRATSQLRVRVRSARRVRRISAMIEKLLDRHNLGECARLSVVKQPNQ